MLYYALPTGAADVIKFDMRYSGGLRDILGKGVHN